MRRYITSILEFVLAVLRDGRTSNGRSPPSGLVPELSTHLKFIKIFLFIRFGFLILNKVHFGLSVVFIFLPF